MEIGFLNGQFIPRDEITISPDDRGFLFADGIYEVVRWYGKGFFDMEGHHKRLKRSLRELRIEWKESGTFPFICETLVKLNKFEGTQVLVYFQVTRGAAKRSHTFPDPPAVPTTYAFARSFIPESEGNENGMKVMLKNEIRWGRCDIKSIALLPNTLSFQEATENGFGECIFIRDGRIAEGSHSNIFFVKNNILYTHPESPHILSGISRNNAIRLAGELGIRVVEEAVGEENISSLDEAFITNTSAEVTPVTYLGEEKVGNGLPGPVTIRIRDRFAMETSHLRG